MVDCICWDSHNVTVVEAVLSGLPKAFAGFSQLPVHVHIALMDDMDNTRCTLITLPDASLS